jgi:capsular exopolysaccharide synthesis family protein
MASRNPLSDDPLPLHVAEEYRRLLTSLRTSAPSARSLLVASCAEGEGATTVAVSLARVFAENPQSRVLLVDAHVRKPSLHRWFDLDLAPGLLESTQQSSPTYRESITVPNLWVLTAGAMGERPLSSIQLSEVLEHVAKRSREDFDVTLWDSAPISHYPDGNHLARLVDGVLVVVQPDKTRLDALAFLRDELGRSGATVLGAVLNRNGRFYPRTLRTGPGR